MREPDHGFLTEFLMIIPSGAAGQPKFLALVLEGFNQGSFNFAGYSALK
jgi:hypothetical protein